MVVAFLLSVVFVVIVISKKSTISLNTANVVGGAFYALACASISFAFLALFLRFATQRRWIYR